MGATISGAAEIERMPLMFYFVYSQVLFCHFLLPQMMKRLRTFNDVEYFVRFPLALNKMHEISAIVPFTWLW